MNILMNQAPTYAKLPRRVIIASDFRTSIRYELLMMDSRISADEKLIKAMKLYYGEEIYNMTTTEVENAVYAIIWFYTCGKSKDEIDEIVNKSDSKERPSNMNRVYDYDYDAEYIYSAFLQQYGIDLQIEQIHWWKFRAMFKALTDQCEFVKIMGYRSMKINNNMTKSQKEFYQEMKRIHALPLPKSERQKIKAIEEALKNGQSLEGLLNVSG